MESRQSDVRPTPGDDDDERRYLLIDGRRWRRSDPSIPPALRQQLVNELMAARRAVKTALAGDDDAMLKQARARVNDAKLALGERGRAWWLPANSEAQRQRLAAAIRALLRQRAAEKTICPSEAARIVGAASWRELMPMVRDVATELAEAGWLEITQRGQVVTPPYRGAIRLRRAADAD